MKCWNDDCKNLDLIREKDGSIQVVYCVYCFRKEFSTNDTDLVYLLISIEDYWNKMVQIQGVRHD